MVKYCNKKGQSDDVVGIAELQSCRVAKKSVFWKAEEKKKKKRRNELDRKGVENNHWRKGSFKNEERKKKGTFRWGKSLKGRKE